MRIKSLFNIFLIIILSISIVAPSYALGNINQKTLLEVKKTFEKQKRALNEFKIDELKSLYTENYTSNDGYNKEKLFNLFKDTWKNHPDIKYDMSITKIKLNGDYATVKTISKTTASTAEPSDITKDNGDLNIDAETIFHIKKIGKSWKIYAEETLSEKIYLLYGSCKDMNIKFYAPELVNADSEYTASLKVPVQFAKFAMGSIKNEVIVYPESETKDIFRSLGSNGILERVLKSNTTNNNETASAYIAFTEPFFDKANNIELRVSGLALIMQRVNVIPQSEFIYNDTKSKENEE